MYIQDIESTHESKTKGKYFLITTKTDDKKATIEVKDVLQYVYPNQKSTNIHYSSQYNDIPILHTNVSTCAQESNPVPETSSHKKLKLQSNEKSNLTKRNTSTEIPHTIHNKSETKSITSIDSRSRGEVKSATFDNEEEPVTSFQQRLKQLGTPLQVINPIDHQNISVG